MEQQWPTETIERFAAYLKCWPCVLQGVYILESKDQWAFSKNSDPVPTSSHPQHTVTTSLRMQVKAEPLAITMVES